MYEIIISIQNDIQKKTLFLWHHFENLYFCKTFFTEWGLNVYSLTNVHYDK